MKENWCLLGKCEDDMERVGCRLLFYFLTQPFGNILNLIPMAEEVKKLNAVCIDCGNNAGFTKRTVDSKATILIGGSEMYQPVCRKCFKKAEEDDMSL